jgi:hypothetical protein
MNVPIYSSVNHHLVAKYIDKRIAGVLVIEVDDGLIGGVLVIGRRRHFCLAKFSAGATWELSTLVRLSGKSNYVHSFESL